jgi:Putative Flp pilus-assembly TadE/G-like
MIKFFINKFWIINNCKGQIAGSGFAIMLIGLMTGVGLIMDTGKLFETRMKVQTSIDASLIACGEYFYRRDKSLSPTEITSCLRGNFEFNISQNGLNVSNGRELDPTSTPPTKDRYVYTPGEVGGANGYMEINCSMRHETILLGLLPGVNIANITTGSSSTGQYSVGGNLPIAVVFSLDISKSISQNEFDILKNAAMNSLEVLPVGSKVALTTFNAGYNGHWSSGKPDKQIWLKNVVSWPGETVWLTISDQDSINFAKNRISGLDIFYWRTPRTYGQGGLYMARKLLEDLDNIGSKGIVFLSDGYMVGSSFPNPIEDNGWYEDAPQLVYENESIPPLGGSQCNDNDTACRSPFYTLDTPNNRMSVVTYGNSYPNITTPLEFETWHKRNLYTQYNQRHIENNGDAPLIQSWPVDETLLPPLYLHYEPMVTADKPSNAMAAREADLARASGIEVFAVCSKCSDLTHTPSYMMQRIGADKELPSNWLDLVGTGGTGNWLLKQDSTATRPGYGTSTGNGKATEYVNDELLVTFDYQRDIANREKTRFYRPASGDIVAVSEFEEIFKSILWDLQKGNLSK